MTSFDTNILLPALREENTGHTAAAAFVQSLNARADVAVSEFVLLELYGLLRNPALVNEPLGAKAAAEICQEFRKHPRWHLIGFPADSRPLHDQIWKHAAERNFARRRVYDERTALTLIQAGVTDFATLNVKDFQNLGFRRVWNPLAA